MGTDDYTQDFFEKEEGTLPMSILEKLLPENGWKDVGVELPTVETRVECAFKYGSMSPHIEIRDSFLKENGKFRGEFDWVGVLKWRYYSNVK